MRMPGVVVAGEVQCRAAGFVFTLYLNILHSTECSVKTRRGDAKIGRDKFKESGPVGRRERGPNLEPSVAITVSWDGDVGA